MQQFYLFTYLLNIPISHTVQTLYKRKTDTDGLNATYNIYFTGKNGASNLILSPYDNVTVMYLKTLENMNFCFICLLII